MQRRFLISLTSLFFSNLKFTQVMLARVLIFEGLTKE